MKTLKFTMLSVLFFALSMAVFYWILSSYSGEMNFDKWNNEYKWVLIVGPTLFNFIFCILFDAVMDHIQDCKDLKKLNDAPS